MPMYDWIKDQQNIIQFVMVDSVNVEVAGLGGTYTLEIRKPGGAFLAGAGVKTEISDGWYQYIGTAAEADTIGNVAIKVTAPGCLQQNLLAVCRYLSTIFPPGAIMITYVVNDGVNPVEGVEGWISTDNVNPPTNVVWKGDSDALGILMDVNGNKPMLDAGTYYVWLQRAGYTPPAYPITIVVS